MTQPPAPRKAAGLRPAPRPRRHAAVIEAFRLGPDGYEDAGRLDGTEPAARPPLSGLALDPRAVWP
ncbi:MAG TPA: hypothetical protein VFX28_01715 [Methylomirabilota bacterium]|nr:hypothetical protein [Methylomirabilota bacterium]